MQLLSFHSFLRSSIFPTLYSLWVNSFQIHLLWRFFQGGLRESLLRQTHQTLPSDNPNSNFSNNDFAAAAFFPTSDSDLGQRTISMPFERSERMNGRSLALLFSAHKKVCRFCRPRPSERGSREGRGIGFVPRI